MTYARDSLLVYPVTTVYLAGVVVAVALTVDLIDLSSGIYLLSLISLIVIGVGIQRELQVVHVLCNGHTEALREQNADLVKRLEHALDRIADLKEALQEERNPEEGKE